MKVPEFRQISGSESDEDLIGSSGREQLYGYGGKDRLYANGGIEYNSPFYDLANVVITPHTSWSSGRVLDRSIELFCDNLRRFRSGEPLQNVVDPVVGY